MKNIEKKGFMLVEALTVLFIFSIIITTFYAAFSTGTRAIIDAKNRLGAISLANEKMEIVRNLAYDKVGVLGGIPNGNLLAEENVNENGSKYLVKTFVQYIDDPLDGIFPTDTIPNDYKRVKITVLWNTGSGAFGSVYLVSCFVPYGLESSVGGGVLAINIVDGMGTGVSQANAQIINSAISPVVNFSANTSNDGNLMFPGAMPSTQKYQIIASKSGYETVSTESPYPISSYYPTDVHASVVSGVLNMKTIVINKLANLNVFTADGLGNKIKGIACDFTITGGRIIGSTPDLMHNSIYNIQNQNDTISSIDGEKILSSISPGQYTIVPVIPSGYVLVGVDPITPFSLQPDTTLEAKIKLASKTNSALLITIQDNESKAINGASVELKNALGYDMIQQTGLDGKTFFYAGTDPLVAGNYDLKITAIGYQDNISQVTINTNELKDLSITISP